MPKNPLYSRPIQSLLTGPAYVPPSFNITDILNRYLDKNAPQSTLPKTAGQTQIPGLQSMSVDISGVQPVTAVPGAMVTTPVIPAITTTAAPAFDTTERDTLVNEIATIEKRLAGSADDRNAELKTKGVFDDLRRLNELKGYLLESQDASIEEPLRARSDLRGTGATTREFQNRVANPLEVSALNELERSRAVQSQALIYQANADAINSYFDQRNAADQFAYQTKQARLNSIDENYASILTEQQKTLLEEKKFNNEFLLKEQEFQNDLFKTALESSIAAGADMSSISRVLSGGGGISDLLAIGGASSTANAANDIIPTVQSSIDTIDSILANEKGIKTSVGSTIFGRNVVTGGNVLDYATGGVFAADDANRFQNDLKNLVSTETLSKFLALKDAGATFGAMSDSEWDIVRQAATKLGVIGATGKSNLSEKDFITEINKVKAAQMKVAIRASMTADQYAATGLRDTQDLSTLTSAYNQVKNRSANNTAAQGIDYAQYDLAGQLAPTFNQLQSEEGFRTEAYRDGTGYSVGFGTQTVGGKPVQAGQTITPETAAKETVSQVLNNYTSFADKITTKLTPNQFAALTSFEYNLGPGIWNQAKDVLAAVNNGNFSLAGSLMQAYNKAGGQVNETLVQRRAREANLLLS